MNKREIGKQESIPSSLLEMLEKFELERKSIQQKVELLEEEKKILLLRKETSHSVIENQKIQSLLSKSKWERTCLMHDYAKRIFKDITDYRNLDYNSLKILRVFYKKIFSLISSDEEIVKGVSLIFFEYRLPNRLYNIRCIKHRALLLKYIEDVEDYNNFEPLILGWLKLPRADSRIFNKELKYLDNVEFWIKELLPIWLFYTNKKKQPFLNPIISFWR